MSANERQLLRFALERIRELEQKVAAQERAQAQPDSQQTPQPQQHAAAAAAPPPSLDSPGAASTAEEEARRLSISKFAPSPRVSHHM